MESHGFIFITHAILKANLCLLAVVVRTCLTQHSLVSTWPFSATPPATTTSWAPSKRGCSSLTPSWKRSVTPAPSGMTTPAASASTSSFSSATGASSPGPPSRCVSSYVDSHLGFPLTEASCVFRARPSSMSQRAFLRILHHKIE